ncbi:MAG: hypothetical protein Q8P67_26050, partial [archaeon]|nr:hypothetical protein [archaeon]
QYDPFKSDPQWCQADTSFLWELSLLVNHYHPSVVKFASRLLDAKPIVYEGDPLQDFAPVRFLDKFSNRDPKQNVKPKGFSIMKPTPSAAVGALPPARNPHFLEVPESEVSSEDRLFHRFFAEKKRSEVPQKKTKRDRELEDIGYYSGESDDYAGSDADVGFAEFASDSDDSFASDDDSSLENADSFAEKPKKSRTAAVARFANSDSSEEENLIDFDAESGNDDDGLFSGSEDEQADRMMAMLAPDDISDSDEDEDEDEDAFDSFQTGNERSQMSKKSSFASSDDFAQLLEQSADVDDDDSWPGGFPKSAGQKKSSSRGGSRGGSSRGRGSRGGSSRGSRGGSGAPSRGDSRGSRRGSRGSSRGGSRGSSRSSGGASLWGK